MSSAHPLDPLTAAEVTPRGRPRAAAPRPVRPRTGRLGRAARAGQGRLPGVEGGRPRRSPREAFCVLLDNGRRRGVEVVVSLDGRSDVVSAADLPEGVQPAIHGDEFVAVVDAVRADPRYVAAVRARGVDPADVHVEPWSSGGVRARPGAARAGDLVGAPRRSRRQPVLAAALRAGRGRRPRRHARAARRRPRAGHAAAVGRAAATTATAAGARTAPTCARSRSRSRRGRASPSPATIWPGRSGTCASASTRARASSCTTSATPTAASGGRSATARRSPSSSSPTATPTRRRTSRTCSTPASTASGR